MNQAKAKPKIARLKRSLGRAGIKQIAIALEAGVTAVHVCNVLAGRDTSDKVVRVAERLLAQKTAVSA